MPLIRFLLIGLASLNSAWALSQFLAEYLRFMIQDFDPLHHAAPFNPVPLIAWLVIALASGLGAVMLYRTSQKAERRIARIWAAPTPTSQPELENGQAA